MVIMFTSKEIAELVERASEYDAAGFVAVYKKNGGIPSQMQQIWLRRHLRGFIDNKKFSRLLDAEIRKPKNIPREKAQ